MALAIFSSSVTVSAFVTKSSASVQQKTSLDAIPPMIIGPMIKKMRENQAKKKMPMVDSDDAAGQAPGIRVGGAAWKWPPIWPYADDFFTPTEDIQTPEPSSQFQTMAGMLNGAPQIPTPDEIEVTDEEEIEKLDVLKYWSEDKGDVKTELDEEAAEKLKR